jgi:hypothetical protein
MCQCQNPYVISLPFNKLAIVCIVNARNTSIFRLGQGQTVARRTSADSEYVWVMTLGGEVTCMGIFIVFISRSRPRPFPPL